MGNPAPQSVITPADGPVPAERIRAALEQFADDYITITQMDNPKNLTHKNWKDLTAADIKNLNAHDFPLIRAAFDFEYYDIVDKIKPDGMSREEFHRAVLRESASRGIIDIPYKSRLGLTGVNENKMVTVKRPLDVDPSKQKTITAKAFDVIMEDAAYRFLQNGRLAALVVEPDVAAQLGLDPKKPFGIGMLNDTNLIDFGYTIRAMKPKLPYYLDLRYDQPGQQERLKTNYCIATAQAYTDAKRILDQGDALSLGDMQALQDSKQNFRGSDQPTGVFGGICPARTPRVASTGNSAVTKR